MFFLFLFSNPASLSQVDPADAPKVDPNAFQRLADLELRDQVNRSTPEVKSPSQAQEACDDVKQLNYTGHPFPNIYFTFTCL